MRIRLELGEQICSPTASFLSTWRADADSDSARSALHVQCVCHVSMNRPCTVPRRRQGYYEMNNAIRATRTALALAFCLAGATFGVIGCQNTAEGAKQDAAKDTAAVGNAAEKTAEATKDAADKAAVATKNAAANAGDALSMTPKVKNAIISNATLNNPKNLINVDTKDNVVHLKGHVLTNDMKKLAGDIAAKTVKEAGSSDTVTNELTVEKH